jgi:hypothetical protein
MINAAITPGIHPARVSKKTISKEPQPLSITESGGKMIARITLNSDIAFSICSDELAKISKRSVGLRA